MSEALISTNVKTAYDEFYEKHDEAWRMLGAKFKAQHIICLLYTSDAAEIYSV